MTRREVEAALQTFTILVDTREQQTLQSEQRYKQFACPYERKKLNFGDYSARCILLDGTEFSIEDSVAVERKMSIDELCGCFTSSRERFTREFERARDADGTIYLLIENADYAKIYLHYYRSRMTTKALNGSILAFMKRFDCQVLFCPPMFSGALIADILRFEMRERLRELKL